ncbi:MAG: DHHW family protein [Oscillospiraceae bacterium]|nr:DHHW family protein [Oscillospiraceae bacterium]
MIGKRISAVIFLVLMLAGMAATALRADLSSLGGGAELLSGQTAALAEKSFSQALPFCRQLRQLAWDTRLFSGERQADGCFISKDSILPNIPEASAPALEANIEGISHFAATNSRIPVYFALIPTVAAIRQDDLPEFSLDCVINQKGVIESVYQALGGKVSAVDVYGTLLNNNNRYLYYRTEDNLTAMGGYFVYSAIASGMGLRVRSLGDFDIQYARHDYVGSLGERFPLARVKPDIISLFHYNNNRRYQVCTTLNGATVTLDSLYDLTRLFSDEPMEVYFGRRGTMTSIRMEESPYTQKLLVFADDTALAWLPILLSHYEEVLLVDLETATQEEIRYLDTLYYDQVLFAYSTDTFMHEDYISSVSGN